MPVILALIVGIILFVVLLKLVVTLVAAVIGIGLAVLVYFAAEKLVGPGR